MASVNSQGAASPREFATKWPLLVSCFALLFLVYGLPLYALPFIYRETATDMGWTREQVTLIASFKFATGASVAILFGSLIDVIGDRRGILIASVVHCLAVTCFLLVDSLSAFYLVGVGMGVSGPAILTGVKTIVSRQFHANQGSAFGMALAGTSMAGVVAPPLVVGLLEHFDWRMTMALLTVGGWWIALPLFLFVGRNQHSPEKATHNAAPGGVRSNRWALAWSMMREPRFWLIGFSIMLVGAVDQGIAQHQVLYLQDDRGLSAGLVAAVASGFAIVGVCSKVMFGAIYDRFSIAGVVAGYLILCVDPLLALLVTGPVTAAIFVLTRGVGHGALIVDTPVLAKHVYGTQNLGLVIGIFSTFLQTGFAIGPWLMGRVHHVFGAYDYGFMAFSGMALVAALMLSRVRPEAWLAQRRTVAGRPASPDVVKAI
jgi:MFS family permease